MGRSGLDLADKLTDYGRMDTPTNVADNENRPASLLRRDRVRHAAWVIGLLVAVLVTALAFGAYRQPELLLNLMGLRYCG
jgi:hypothetical protein